MGTFSDWSLWADAECSVTCGGGHQKRTRTCSDPSRDTACAGSSQQTQPCNTEPCDRNQKKFSDLKTMLL